MPLDHSDSPTVDLLIPGMSCASCMAGIEKALGGVRGVLSARCNLTRRKVTVQLDPELVDEPQLIRVLEEAGWQARSARLILTDHDDDQIGRALLLRIGVAGFAAMNVMLLSISVWSGADGPMRELLHWISALITVPAASYSGAPFFRSAGKALAARRMNMDTPISVAIILSVLGSIIETALGGAHAYFEAVLMLVFFLLIGRYLDHRTRARARSSVAELGDLIGGTCTRVDENGAHHDCLVEKVEPGMRLAIAAGGRIPADGSVTQGCSDLDRSLVTGESVPERVGPGAAVHAGMLNLTGPLEMTVSAVGDRTLLAEISRLVEAAEHGRGRYDRLSERAARIFAPAIHVVSLLAFCGWMAATGDWRLSLSIAIAVLIITCPCALALAIPTVHTVASGRLFRSGTFLKDGAELERLADVDMVVLDKTGTLTLGTPSLVNGDEIPAAHWPVIAALAAGSRHPYAKALTAVAKTLGVRPAELSHIREHPGAGVSAEWQGRELRLGRPDWVGISAEGYNLGVMLGDGQRIGLSCEDDLRPGAAETCLALGAMGLKVVLLSGDRLASVASAAAAAGIPEFYAQTTPAEKIARIEAWQQAGHKVLMVGDGLNDGPALAAAHASMSPASASDLAKNSAGLVFTSASLAPVQAAIVTARTARRRALQSFGFAGAYNVLAVPLALAGLVTPLIAAICMSASSLVVVLNALRMRRS